MKLINAISLCFRDADTAINLHSYSNVLTRLLTASLHENLTRGNEEYCHHLATVIGKTITKAPFRVRSQEGEKGRSMTKMSTFLYWLWLLTCMAMVVDAFVISNRRPTAFSPIVHSTFFPMQPLNGDDENSMSDLVEEIWIEDEQFGGEIRKEDAESPGFKVVDPNDYENVVDNCVFVTLKNGKKFWAAFYTYSSIEWLAKRHQRNGDYLGGKYFQDERMILIDRYSRKDIEDVIHGILKENNGTLAPEFTRIDPWWYPRKLWSTVSFEVTHWLQEALESTFSRTALATWKGEGLPLRRLRRRLRRRRKWRQNKNSSS